MAVAHRLRILALTLALLVPHLEANAGQKESLRANKPIVYDHVEKGSESPGDAEAKALYREKFKIIDFSGERGYTHSKNTKRLIPRPVIENGRTVKGDVRLVFIVNQEGHVVMPSVVHSTNTKLNQAVLNVITQWRGTPALLNGAPIAVLLYQDFRFH